MNKIIDLADRYIEEMSYADFGMLKFCLCAVGMMFGLSFGQSKYKKPLMIGAAIVFCATYIPLMMKFLGLICPYCDIDEIMEDSVSVEI